MMAFPLYQRINQEFSRLRKENQELLEKVKHSQASREKAPVTPGMSAADLPLITPRTAA
jgi:hypothetical protein